MFLEKDTRYYSEVKMWSQLNVDKILKYVNKGRCVVLTNNRFGLVKKIDKKVSFKYYIKIRRVKYVW